MSGAYAAAMAADRARLESAKKRNLEQASLHGEEDDAVQGAWDSVLRGGQQQAAESEEEARRKKAQKKTEKRNAKRAETAANAGNLSLYVSGIPKELSFNAVQNLFSKARPRALAHRSPWPYLTRALALIRSSPRRAPTISNPDPNPDPKPASPLRRAR